MFWGNKKKEKLASTKAVVADLHILPTKDKLTPLYLRRKVLDWRDDNLVNIESHLNREIGTLSSSVDEELDKLGILDSTINLRRVHKETIQPLVKDWAVNESRYLLDEAQKGLNLIHELKLEEVTHNADIETHDSKAHVVDAATATAAGVGGIFAIPAFTSASVVSTGGVLGLLGVTTISLPIAIFGVAVVSVLLALGGSQFANLREKALKRYKIYLKKSVRHLVVDPDNGKEQSLCTQLQAKVRQAADQILKDI